MSYLLGLKAIKKLVEQEDAYAYHRAKLSAKLFRGDSEKQVFAWVDDHVTKFSKLPQLVTLEQAYPEVKEVECPEPAKYYLHHVEQRFMYDRLSKANKDAHDLLKTDQHNPEKAKDALVLALNEITEQQHRHRIMNFNTEGKGIVINAYFKTGGSERPPTSFGWPYMDDLGGAQPGDIVSFVGRPAMGKSLFMLYVGAHNWKVLHKNVLFVSMEMNCLSVAQRLAAMYASTNLTQLKMGQYGDKTFAKFAAKVNQLQDEHAQFYVVDGNLAACVEDIYILAQQLACEVVVIDGAYLMLHKNQRLNRFERVAENCSLMKRMTEDNEVPTFASWQFAKDAAKSKLKGEKAGLEHIGLSEAIGQISSIVLGLNQEDGVETMNTRVISLMKGRNGEVGEFRVNWDWTRMDFTQNGVVKPEDEPEPKTHGYI